MAVKEGYLMIDHRASPGVPGLPALFESGVYNCGHCQGTVLKHPLRTRAREECKKCGTVICDGCAKVMSLTLECDTFARKADQALEQAFHSQEQ